MKIKVTQLETLVAKALKNYGYNETEIPIISKILLFAQLRGNNQGVVKLIGKGIPRRNETGAPTIVKETPVSARFDGNKNHAMIVMNMTTETAIEKAKKTGIGIVGSFNTSESTGVLGYYVNKIAKEGLIGIAYVASPFKTTAPYGSNEALFCTNPIAHGIPTTTDPIIFDMSTSTMAYYGLIEANTAGKTVPEGTGFDKDGNPSQNPAEIMAGALRAFGGYKGSGMALMVQILGAVLVGADSFNSESDNAGNLVMAIDPDVLTSKEEFAQKVSDILARIKSARRVDEGTEILIPGERASSFNKGVLETGEIEIEENLYNELVKVAG